MANLITMHSLRQFFGFMRKIFNFLESRILAALAQHGYLKDLPEILYRILKLEMERKAYSREGPLFQESSVKSENRGGETEMDKEKRRVLRKGKDMSWARIGALFHLEVERYQYLHISIADTDIWEVIWVFQQGNSMEWQWLMGIQMVHWQHCWREVWFHC